MNDTANSMTSSVMNAIGSWNSSEVVRLFFEQPSWNLITDLLVIRFRMNRTCSKKKFNGFADTDFGLETLLATGQGHGLLRIYVSIRQYKYNISRCMAI